MVLADPMSINLLKQNAAFFIANRRTIVTAATRYLIPRSTSFCSKRRESDGITYCKLRFLRARQRTASNFVDGFSRTMASSSGAGSSSDQNRLATEKSPYLLQHASNPVNWYPWGAEAMALAKAEDKPIFLSVGYSTCHWCHVMERESFESPEIGQLLNQSFVSIKVDREERPDVDRVYMTYVQASTGHGGWPMSVFLTPDLKPIFGGTYFPPDDRYFGRPGFKSLLNLIAEKWKTHRSQIDTQGTAILDALMRGTQVADSEMSEMPTASVFGKMFEMMDKAYDEDDGGFGKAPKFPQPVNFTALFRFYHMNRESEEGKKALEMCLHTLRMMAKGGIHDHVAKGFHRYSTDKIWHVPHFEKMLYDQAQLAVSYIEAYQITKEELFADVARGIFQYVNRDLSHPAGGFYSAEDADSLPTADTGEKKEGAFCVWTWRELQTLLDEPVARKEEEGGGNTATVLLADLFCHHYSCAETGNVDPLQDPHDELKGQNVLMERAGMAETAAKFGLQQEAVNEALQRGRDLLFLHRLKRPKPHLDNKMVAAWNGLMMSGVARGGQVLGDPELVQRAVSAATFVQTHLYDADTNTLLRSCYTAEDGGVAQIATPIGGFLDDYAFVIRGLMDVYEACLDPRWLGLCERLQEKQDQLFWDTEGGGYYSTADGDSSIVLRIKEDQDGAEPSANSVSCLNLLRLGAFLDRPDFSEKGERILKVFSSRLNAAPFAVTEMVSALAFYLHTPIQVVIAGESESEATTAMLRAVHQHFLPHKVLLLASSDVDTTCLASRLAAFRPTAGSQKASGHLCKHWSCSAPTDSLQTWQTQLEQL